MPSQKLTSSCIVLLLTLSSFAQQFEFAYSLGANPISVADFELADFNNDGHSDIVMYHNNFIDEPGVQTYRKVTVIHYNSLTTNWDYSVIDTVAQTGLVQVKDLNSDGLVDILFMRHDNSDVVWYENIDGSTFESPVPIADGLLIGVLNIDSDSYPDVLFNQDGTIVWLRNNGNAEFLESTDVIEVSSNTRGSITDIDQDGLLDIQIVLDPNELSWMKNNGDGFFMPPEVILNNISSSASLFTDINQDGFKDYISANQVTNDIDIYLNDGNQLFEWSATIDSSSYSCWHLRSFDYDLDGDLDLISNGDDTLKVHERISETEFFEHPPIFMDHRYLSGMAYFDFDQDGDQDIICSSVYDGGLKIWRNTTLIDNLAEHSKDLVTVYPNPAEEEATIELARLTNFLKYEVIDSNGRVVRRQSLTQVSAFRVNRNSLPDGLYYIHLISESESNYYPLVFR